MKEEKDYEILDDDPIYSLQRDVDIIYLFTSVLFIFYIMVPAAKYIIVFLLGVFR